MKSVVFCTTCKGRAQHVEQTLPRNLADNAGYENCRFLILDYGSPDHLLEYLRENHQKDIDSGRVVLYRFAEVGPFRMAHAKNMAHRLGILEGADVLVNLDADNFTGEGFAEYVSQHFESSRDIFLWAKMVPGNYARGISGRIAVSANWFLKCGGYDEKYSTWSPDDKDFNARLRRCGCDGIEIEPKFLDAVLHSEKMRFKEYKHAQAMGGEESFDVSGSDCRIANHGRFGRGVVRRNFDDSPIVLGDVPTRIFGVGMHKTATTSLHHAFEMLGLDSAHWKSAHWAKRIWDEIRDFGKSLTLEKSYALCDLPITLLYRALDIAYPGSKFILTTRLEYNWLRSVERHWSDRNPFRSQWDTDPFTHKIHVELYGRKKFDADVMIQRFRRHNAEVDEYFKDRVSDLLTFNVDAGDGWEKLCGFLGRPVPNCEYPRAFASC